MQLLPEIEERHAFRALDPRPLEEDVLVGLFQAARLAPSCGNKQPWKFILITGEKERAAFNEALAGGNYWAKRAPAVILVVTSPERDFRLEDRRDYALFDTGLAAMNLILQAQKEGIIAHPIAGFDPAMVKKAAGIPEEEILITCIILGHPGDASHLSEKHLREEQGERKRRPFETTVSLNHWDNRWTPDVQGENG